MNRMILGFLIAFPGLTINIRYTDENGRADGPGAAKAR